MYKASQVFTLRVFTLRDCRKYHNFRKFTISAYANSCFFPTTQGFYGELLSNLIKL